MAGGTPCGIEVLTNVYLSSQQQPKEMWSDTTLVVEALHKAELDRVLGQIANLRATGNQQNVRLIGRPGIGKSHFLGRVRRRGAPAPDRGSLRSGRRFGDCPRSEQRPRAPRLPMAGRTRHLVSGR